MDIAFTDFLTRFSLALDLLNPENGPRGIRRAYIAMTILQQQGTSLDVQQNIFIAALLYELGSKRVPGLSHCQDQCQDIPLIAKSAPLIFEKSVLHAHSRLLDLVDNVDLLALYDFPRGHYPASAIETVCDSIGSRYSLDDILCLRELEPYPEIWLKLASPTLIDGIRASSPFSTQTLHDDELAQLAGLLARIIDRHCQYTEPYSARVAEYSIRLARLYGFSNSGIKEMHLAGLLHGVGKLALSTEHFTNPALLTADKRKEFQAYPLATREILSGIPGMYNTAIIASRQHEQPNGKGFPDALYGTQLDLSARIISVACAYVSLLVGCHSKKEFSPVRALEEMKSKSAAGLLDPDIVDALEMTISRGSSTVDCTTPVNALLEGVL